MRFGGHASCLYPLIRAGPERQRLGQIEASLSLQVIRQERRQHVAPVILRGRTAEIDGPELSPFASRPSAMVPRTDDEEVLVRRVVPLEQFVDLDRTVKIFLVPPAGHVQRRHRHAFQPRREGLPLPESIVIGMIDEVVPGWEPVVEILPVDIRQRPELEIPLVSVASDR